MIDYESKRRYGRYYNRLYRLPGNKLSVYKVNVNDGIIELEDDSLHKVHVHLQDRAGNKTSLSFNLKRTEYTPKQGATIGPESERFKYDQKNTFNSEEVKLEFTKGSFYNDFNFQYVEGDMSKKGFSYVHKVHNGYTPVHKSFSIGIKAHDLPEYLHDKAFISRYGRSIAHCAKSDSAW